MNKPLETLVVERTYSAPIEKVFNAWTKAELLAQWFGPKDFDVAHSEIDLKVGGKYLIDVKAPDGTRIKHYGEYVEISAPTRLAFTWILDNQDCQGSAGQRADTLVTIDLKVIDQDTHLKLLHEKLPDQQAIDGHRMGWESSFEALAAFLS